MVSFLRVLLGLSVVLFLAPATYLLLVCPVSWLFFGVDWWPPAYSSADPQRQLAAGLVTMFVIPAWMGLWLAVCIFVEEIRCAR